MHQFEIGIYPGRDDDYDLYVRYDTSSSEAPQTTNARAIQIDHEALRAAEADCDAYGRILTETVFGPDNIRKVYFLAREAARNDRTTLRMRLKLGVTAPRLNAIRWETLQDPEDNTRMATNQNLLFSRLVNDSDWRQVRLRSKSSMTALIVVSEPKDLDKYNLASFDAAKEVENAKNALGRIKSKCIGIDEYATVRAVFAEMRKGYDILYLICHGGFRDQRPRLWFQNDEGNSAVVSGSDIVNQCKELRNLPRLAMLASCESASGGGEGSAAAHLAPRLTEAGIPAVIGMQGPISIESASRFVPKFFRELQRSGLVDEAVNEARQSIREVADWWAPCLVMRLNTGRIWYRPGFTSKRENGDSDSEQDTWTALVRNIVNRQCTPIVGPDLVSGFVGSRRDIANRWADTFRFPMAMRDRENLPQVAQFLAVQIQREFPQDELLKYIYREASQQYRLAGSPARDELNVDRMPTSEIAAELQSLLSEYGKRLREKDPAEPHSVLAKLESSVYITTNYGNTLEEALVDAGKEPVVELCRWNKFTNDLPSIQEQYPKYRPTKERPLVFKVFGQLSMPESIVLTEDDYFDFLIGSTRFRSLIPRAVGGALCSTALLFIGYELDDWDFRVVFRSIIGQDGWEANTGVKHVAATLDPEEGRIIEPERARKYLEKYFASAKIDVYWGGSDEFLRALYKQISD